MEAYGALVAGYARLRMVTPAVDAVRRYHSAGGSPDVRMLESLADVCVRQGEYKVALQVRQETVLGAVGTGEVGLYQRKLGFGTSQLGQAEEG